MNVLPQGRIVAEDGTVYAVGESRFITDRYVYVSARMLFRNYRDQDRTLFEAPDDEAMPVLLRIHREVADGRAQRDPALLDRIVREARSRTGLAFKSPGRPGLPVPVDLITWSPVGAEGAIEAPVWVFADTAGRSWLDRPGDASTALEVLQALAWLDQDGLRPLSLDPRSIIVDAEGRWAWLDVDVDRVKSRADGRETARLWAEFVRSIADAPGSVGHRGFQETLERAACGTVGPGEALAGPSALGRLVGRLRGR